MHLRDYAGKFPDRKPREWGKLFGISRTHFIHLCDGTRNPSKGLMRTIAKKTGGEVDVLSWFEDEPEHVEP